MFLFQQTGKGKEYNSLYLIQTIDIFSYMSLLLNEVITSEREALGFRVICAEKHPNLSNLQFWSILEARNAKNEASSFGERLKG